VRIFLIVVAVLLGVSVVGLVVAGPSALKMMPSFGVSEEPLAVRLATVASRELVETVSAPGELDPEVKVDVSAEVSARVLEVPFREGSTVRKGELIVKLDDRDLQASLSAQMARRDGERFRLRSEQERLASPASQLVNAKSALERQESLFKTGDVSRATLDDAVARVRDIEAQIASAKEGLSVIESSLAAAEADIQRARELLKKTTIFAPIDGQITELNAEPGELVVVGTMNNAGTKILTIADLGSVRLKAKVAESDVARVRAGQAATVRVNAYRKREFQGTVERVALSRGTEQSFGSTSGGTGSGSGGWFKCEVNLQLTDGETLLSGLAANVDIVVDRTQGLLIPSQALMERKLDDLPTTMVDSPLVDKIRKKATVVFSHGRGQGRDDVGETRRIESRGHDDHRRAQRRRCHRDWSVPRARATQGWGRDSRRDGQGCGGAVGRSFFNWKYGWLSPTQPLRAATARMARPMILRVSRSFVCARCQRFIASASKSFTRCAASSSPSVATKWWPSWVHRARARAR
jgi:HlyD family secretion protein